MSSKTKRKLEPEDFKLKLFNTMRELYEMGHPVHAIQSDFEEGIGYLEQQEINDYIRESEQARLKINQQKTKPNTKQKRMKFF